MRAAAFIFLGALLLLINSGFAQEQSWRQMVFRPDAPGVDENPLRGLIPFSGMRQGENSFPHSMEWFYLPLSDVIAGPDTYKWDALEKQLNDISRRGHQAVFRFYLDYPGRRSGIPRYLLKAGLHAFKYDDFGNGTSLTHSVSPDYSDPRLIDCLIRFIRAFGAEYDGDVRIAYLTAGLYGFWGEWHVTGHPRPGEDAGWSMTQRDKDALLHAYQASFRKTPVLVRYPWVSTSRELLANFGFHDDSLLKDTLGEESWGFWRGMKNAGLVESWQFHPTGGEIYPQLQAGLWDVWPNSRGQDVEKTIETSHVSWMLDNDLFVKTPSEMEKANALRAQRLLGYTLYCKADRLARSPNGAALVSVLIENRGDAPMYYTWPVEVEVLTADGRVVGRGKAEWPLPRLQPGQLVEWSVQLDALPDTAKTILLRIANPMPNGHSVAFANAEMGTVASGWLTLNLLQ
jgi:hypothetical protein